MGMQLEMGAINFFQNAASETDDPVAKKNIQRYLRGRKISL